MPGYSPQIDHKDTDWAYIKETDEYVRIKNGHLQSHTGTGSEEAVDVENPGDTYDDAQYFVGLVEAVIPGVTLTAEDWGIK